MPKSRGLSKNVLNRVRKTYVACVLKFLTIDESY